MAELEPLPGSERPAPDARQELGPVDPDEQIEVTVYLRRDPSADRTFDAAREAQRPLPERHYLTDEEAAATYGAAPAEIEQVLEFAAAHGLSPVRVNQAARSVKLQGTTQAVAEAFGVKLRTIEVSGRRFRTHDAQVMLPAAVRPVVEAVFGLDNRPLGRSHRRPAPDEIQTAIRDGLASGAQPADTYLPPQVAALYDFPDQSAAGETVAVLAFNGPSTPGGYEPSVLEQYFADQLDLPMPSITDVTVQGPGNDPGDGSSPDDASPEVYLDLSIVGSLATGARIVLYFTEFTEQGWVDVLSEATTDSTNSPSVISISYGNPEDGVGTAWSAAAITQVDQSLEAASAKGVTITVAAGDSGATDGESSGVHVDFPASSPWVLGCGGTRLESAGGAITSEVVWNDLTASGGGEGATGGGVSAVFALPSWQAGAGVPDRVGTGQPGRGVPDVSSLADPQTPFIVAQPGGTGGVGGTSAAAPLWASLVARCNAALGKPVGFLNPTLYTLPAGTLRDITSGDNSAPGGEGYQAGPGWDACTGFGSPGASTLLSALQ